MDNRKILKKTIEVIELSQRMDNIEFKDIYNGLNINEVHTIDFINKGNNINVTAISKKLNITRGGASKISKKLISKGYILEYKLEGNKKAKYFSLTKKGKEIFKKHEKNHKLAIKRDSKLFEDFSDAEKEVISKFLDVIKNDLKNKIDNN